MPSSGDLPNPGIEPEFFTSPELAGGFFTTGAMWEAQNLRWNIQMNSLYPLINPKGKDSPVSGTTFSISTLIPKCCSQLYRNEDSMLIPALG